VSDVEDAPPARLRLHRRDRRREVVKQVIVQVPAVVEVRREASAGLLRAVALQLLVALAVAPELHDVDVQAEVEEVLDALAAGPGVPVLGEAVHQEERLAEQRLVEGLRLRLVARDHQRPPVGRLHWVLGLPVEVPERDLVDRGRHDGDVRSGKTHRPLTLGSVLRRAKHHAWWSAQPEPATCSVSAFTAPTRYSDPATSTHASVPARARARDRASSGEGATSTTAHRDRASCRYEAGSRLRGVGTGVKVAEAHRGRSIRSIGSTRLSETTPKTR